VVLNRLFFWFRRKLSSQNRNDLPASDHRVICFVFKVNRRFAVSKPKIQLFHATIVICAVVGALGVWAPEGLAAVSSSLTGAAFRAADWFFMATVTGFLIVAAYAAFGPYSRIRLGPDDARPEFSTLSWLSMLFAAGMGVGLLFWGAAEPLHHFTENMTGLKASPEAARQSFVITGLHWGLHAWAIYGIAALVIGYFGFRKGKASLPSSPISAVFKGKWVRPVSTLSDGLAVVAIAFGVAGSIGMGIFQLHAGMHVVFGVPAESVATDVVILAVLFVAYMTSASTSLDKGIQILSNLNMIVALLLLLFVLVAGPTSFLLRTFVTAIGDYLTALPRMSLSLYPYQESRGWLSSWTLTYFIWWIAWAPFVGVFIARISKGRTIREFILGVLLMPTLFSMLWFSVFGGTALHEEMFGGGGLVTLVREDVSLALFSLFDRLPMSGLLSATSLMLVFIFLVTSVDSATFVLGMLTSNGSDNPSTKRKLGWGITLAVLGGALMLSGNLHAVRAVSVSGAIPFTLVMVLQVVAFLRTIRAERLVAVDEQNDAMAEDATTQEAA